MKEAKDFLFFWGKQDVFSNFYYSPFKHQGQLFKWSEQATNELPDVEVTYSVEYGR
ncbi:hypothetical protein [Lysinibacillus sp. RS5]|uniref:hypothetical protein n=1 Tax=unclassified Lysinibacillus TaxID=2636778 RepID=UPI0035BE5546